MHRRGWKSLQVGALNHVSYLQSGKETYTVTSFDVSNWRLLFIPAMMSLLWPKGNKSWFVE